MPVQVSVVVPADVKRPPNGVLGTLDAQSLPTGSFELAILDLGLDAGQRRSLERLAARRSNVAILPADADWIALLNCTYLLEVGDDHRLFPETLQRLVAHADAHGLDVVAGRVVQLGQPLLATFLRDEPVLHGEARGIALSSPVRLLRRERVRREGNALTFEVAGARVGVVSSYPAAHAPGPARQLALTLAVDPPVLAWQGADIRLLATGSVIEEDAADLTPVLLIRQVGSFLTYVLPSTGGVTGTGSHVRWEVTSAFSPLTAAAGGPLSKGQWQVDVALTGPTRGSAQVRLPGASLPAGLLDGLALAVADGPRDTLHLDVGPSRLPLIEKADAAGATVTESAAGSLLRLRLPQVNVATHTPLPGFLALDRFQLPAVIETASGTAELTAFVSGLAGSYEISTQFGSAPLCPTGLTLQVSGDGTQAVLPTPARAEVTAPKVALDATPVKVRKTPSSPPRAKPAPGRPSPAKPRSTKRKKAAPKASGPVARLRRAVTFALEPQTRRLRKQPLARALYRRATGLAGAKSSGARSR